MKTKLISIILFLVFVCSCLRTLPDEELTMARTPYAGKNIRLDGGYISDPDELNICEYDFFYANGVMFALGDLFNIENINQFTNGLNNTRKSYWGVFQVENDTIKAQKWIMSDVSSQFIVQKRYYKIINDTTLAVYLVNNGNLRHYHFKRFIPKPDSTNVFIK